MFIDYFDIQTNNYNLITSISIQIKRKLLFKLNETLSTLPKLIQLANQTNLMIVIHDLTVAVQ